MPVVGLFELHTLTSTAIFLTTVTARSQTSRRFRANAEVWGDDFKVWVQ
jgi:hypothetical protein